MEFAQLREQPMMFDMLMFMAILFQLYSRAQPIRAKRQPMETNRQAQLSHINSERHYSFFIVFVMYLEAALEAQRTYNHTVCGLLINCEDIDKLEELRDLLEKGLTRLHELEEMVPKAPLEEEPAAEEEESVEEEEEEEDTPIMILRHNMTMAWKKVENAANEQERAKARQKYDEHKRIYLENE